MINDSNMKQYIKDNNGTGTYLLKDKGEGDGDFIAKWDMDIPEPTDQQLTEAAAAVEASKAYKPSDMEVRLKALEDKAGVTQGDRDTARQALIDARA